MKKLFTLLLILFILIFSTKTIAQCDAPTNLTSSYNNNVSTFSWDAVIGATYTIEFKYPSYTWDNIEYVTTVSTNSLVLTGIIQSATFDWRVKANCSSSVSNYSQSQITIPCPLPTGLNITNLTSTSAILNWVPAAGYNTIVSDFVISYRVANSNAAWIFLGHSSGTSINLNGLNPNTTYEWCVNQTCSYFNSSPAISQFTTQVALCASPINLSTSNVSSNSVTLNWGAVNNYVSYNVQYKPVSSNTWSSIINTSSSSLLISGLNSSTTYDWKVMANCNGSNSVYSSSQFTTASCLSFGNNSSEWIDLFRLGSINRSSGAEYGGYINTGLSTNLTIGSTGNSGQISAGFNGKAKSQTFKIYIDLNNNNSFNDPGELVLANGTITKSNNVNFSFNIPSTATAGITKMRVIMSRNGTTINPCLTNFNGETEDYDVNLVGANTSNKEIEVSSQIEVLKNSTNISISPNPSNGVYTITMPKEFQAKSYNIINLNGSIIKSEILKNASIFKIDITNNTRGVYLLKVTDNEGKQHTQKLLLN